MWRRNLIMRDRETGTLWQQATGAALMGPLEGQRLQPLAAERMTGLGWLHIQPDSTLAAPDASWSGIMPRGFTIRLLERANPFFRRSGTQALDHRLRAMDDVVGVFIGRRARAYPVAALPESGVLEEFAVDSALTVVYWRDADRVRVYLRPYAALAIRPAPPDQPGPSTMSLVSSDGRLRWNADGTPLTPATPALKELPFVRTNWAGWQEFHSATDVWQPDTDH